METWVYWFIILLVVMFIGQIDKAHGEIYYMRVDGTAEKNFASGPATDASACMNSTTFRMSKFYPGDTIYVSDQGGVYNYPGNVQHHYLYINDNGNHADWIQIKNVPSEKPVFSAYRHIPNWQKSNLWRKENGKIWSIMTNGPQWDSYRENPRRLRFDDVEYHPAENADSVDSIYRWYHDASSHRLYVYSANNPSIEYTSLKGLQDSIKPVLIDGGSYIKISGLTIDGAYDTSVVLTGGAEGPVHHVKLFGNIIYSGYLHGIMIFGNNYDCYEIDIYDNVIDGLAKWSHTRDQGVTSDGIGVNESAHDVRIFDNIIKNVGHTGIQVHALDPTKEVYNINIYNNDISGQGSGKGYMRCLGTAGVNKIIGKGSTLQHCTFHHNHCHDLSVSNQFNGHHCEIYYNVFENMQRGNASHCSGLRLRGNGVIGSCEYNKVYNNVFSNISGSAINTIAENEPINNNAICNNIFFNTGFGNNFSDGSTYDKHNTAIVFLNHTLVSNNEIRNNVIWNPNSKARVYYNGSYFDTDSFNLADTNEDLISNNLFEDPLFVDPKNGYFSLLSTSPCIDAGKFIGQHQDFAGSNVPYNNATDIGAFEFISSKPIKALPQSD